MNGYSAEQASASDRAIAGRPLCRRRKLLYAVVTAMLFLVVVEFGLFVVGVSPVSETEDPYVGFSSYLPLFERQDDHTFATANNKLAFFNSQSFPAEKPNGTCRVFCLGGSTTYGRPYDDLTSFAGWLRLFLPHADPSGSWEVINAGGISYASYRVASVMQELVEYDPDLFIVYCGHNEFLEERTYQTLTTGFPLISAVGGLVSRSRTYSVMHKLLKGNNGVSPTGRDILPAEVVTLLDGSVGPQDYHRNDGLKLKIQKHFEINLRRIVALAKQNGVKILLVVPASNLRDCSPFRSDCSEQTTFNDANEIEYLNGESRHLAASGKWAEALAVSEASLAIDERFAESHYRQGKALYGLGRFGKSAEAFERALEEDVCPLRILPDMQQTVSRVANDYDVPCCRFDELVSRESDHGIPGGDLFLDHVHPTIEGNRLLATAILDEMSAAGWLSFSPNWTVERQQQISAELTGRLDQAAHGIALRNLSKVMGWAGKTDEAFELALKAVALAPNDAETQFQAGIVYEADGELRQAESHYRTAGELDGNFKAVYLNLGVVLGKQSRFDEALEQFQRGIEIDPTSPALHANLATVFAMQGDFEAAVLSQSRAVRLTDGKQRQALQLTLREYEQAVR